MNSASRLALAITGATVLTPILLLLGMPLLDPLWSIRPAITPQYVLLLGGITFVSLIITAVPLAVVTRWLRNGRTVRLAAANATVGVAASLPFVLQGNHISPAPLILGAVIAIASLIVSAIYLATKERSSHG